MIRREGDKYPLLILILLSIQLSSGQDLSPPSITEFALTGSASDHHVRLSVNDRIVSNPFLNGAPRPLVTFYKDEQVIARDVSSYIRRVNLSDAGMYWIVANNSLGAVISPKIRLSIYYLEPWPDKDITEQITVNEGRAKVISLPPISAFPTPELSHGNALAWHKAAEIINNNQHYYISLQKDLVLLDTPTGFHDQTYRAKYVNILALGITEALSRTFKLSVTPTGETNINPSTVIPLPPVSKVMGVFKRLDLECVFNARPIQNLVIQWYRISKSEGTRTQFSSGVNYNGRQLSISTVDASYNGDTIECEGSLNGEKVVSNTVIQLLVSPSFPMPPPSHLDVDLGREVQIPCRTSGTPTPNITWYRNAIPLSTGQRLVVFPNGTLTIYNIVVSDSAVYQCEASNDAGQVLVQTYLKIISSPPTLKTQPSNSTMIAGSDANIACIAEGKPTPEVQWTFKSAFSGGEQTIGTFGQFTVSPSGLRIASTDWSNSGEYTCTATNSLGQVSQSGHLAVYNSTRIITTSTDKEEPKGISTTRQCQLTKDWRIPATTLWLYNGQTLVPNPPTITLTDNNQTLSFGSLTIAYQGLFTCNVYSKAGNDSITHNVTVVEVPNRPSPQVKLSPTEPRTIIIEWLEPYNGNKPIRKYTVRQRINGGDWTLESDNLPATAGLMSHKVTGLKPSKTYEFEVTASNDIGDGRPSLPTTPQKIPAESPSAPPSVRDVHALSDSRIRIRFVPPPEDHWNGDLEGYEIHYYLPGNSLNPRVDRYNQASNTEMTYDINGLLPDTQYYVKVAAFNEVGVGVFSAETVESTGEGVPQVAVAMKSYKAINSTAVSLTWERPERPRIQGETRGYYVNATRVGSTQPAIPPQIAPTNTLSRIESFILGGLEKYTSYRISITLFTNGGLSPPAWVDILTDQDTPGPVSNLTVVDRTHDAISIQWAPPNVKNGIITGYNVTITGPGLNRAFALDNSTTNKTIAQLRHTTSYTLVVKASTIKGLGVPKPKVVLTRPPPVAPQSVTSLRVSKRNARNVTLSFTPGDDGQAPVTAWLVQARSSLSETWSQVDRIENRPDARELVVRKLKPYSEYYFRVISRNIVGNSPPSESTPDIIRTEMAKPEYPPRDVAARPQNHTTLIINWEPLTWDNFNGEPTGYTVEYRAETGDVLTQTITDPMERFLILGGLESYTNYTIFIIAKNTQFSSGPSQAVSSTTIESVPQRAPRITEITAASATEVMVSWEALSPQEANGEVLGYRVLVHGGDSTESHTTQLQRLMIDSLLSYTQYKIQVLAFTRIGDGVRSQNASVQTQPTAPSEPKSMGAQHITASSAKITWLPPLYPNSNGDIRYDLSYKGLTGDTNTRSHSALSAMQYLVNDLQPEVIYEFKLKAINNRGASPVVTISLKASMSLDVPGTPGQFRVTGHTSRSVKLGWGRDLNDNVQPRNYTLAMRTDSTEYQNVQAYIPGTASEYDLTGLQPNTKYYFQIAANNDIGQSLFTNPKMQQTSPEVPSYPPRGLRVIPESESSLNITWEHPLTGHNGQLTHTKIWYSVYQPESKASWDTFSSKDVQYPASTSMLSGLTQGELYEIRISAGNSQGYSVASRPVVIYVGVAVPIGSPSDVNVSRVDDTGSELVISWKPVPTDQLNGQLLGYKIYYQVAGERQRRAVEVNFSIAPPQSSSYVLKGLKTYTEYMVQVTAFNIAGEGPKSQPTSVVTDQGKPSAPTNLEFTEVTLSLVNVTWGLPDEPNGIILDYMVIYYRDSSSDEPRNVPPSRTFEHIVLSPMIHDEVKQLDPNTTYFFSVRARTSKGYGETITSKFTTGPYKGVPSPPRKAEYTEEEDGVMMVWKEGSSGDADVIGFVIEGFHDKWELVMRGDGDGDSRVLLPQEIVSPEGVSLYSQYQVSLYNELGLGKGLQAQKVTPFYKTWWFRVIVALAALTIIIAVVALLSCYCYRQKVKMVEEAYEQDVIGIDGDYPTYEMRQSSLRRDKDRRGSKYRTEPPRPSPGAVLYSPEDEPPGYDSSSVTEKEELSSDDETKGNVSGSDSSDDDVTKGGSVTPSYNHYQYGGYNHYVSSGAVQQSWQNSYGRARSRNMYSYTDSEAESSMPSTSHYRQGLGLNQPSSSRQHLVLSSPDGPGSRAPLPNFSSFV